MSVWRILFPGYWSWVFQVSISRVQKTDLQLLSWTPIGYICLRHPSLTGQLQVHHSDSRLLGLIIIKYLNISIPSQLYLELSTWAFQRKNLIGRNSHSTLNNKPTHPWVKVRFSPRHSSAISGPSCPEEGKVSPPLWPWFSKRRTLHMYVWMSDVDKWRTANRKWQRLLMWLLSS